MKLPATGRCFVIVAVCFCPVHMTFAQEVAPTPSTPDRSGVTIEEVDRHWFEHSHLRRSRSQPGRYLSQGGHHPTWGPFRH